MRKDSGEINQLVEQVEYCGLLGAEPPRDFFAAAFCQPHELLSDNQRLDDENFMLFKQPGDLRPDRRKAAVLYFNKLTIAHRIDPKPGNPLLNAGLGTGVESFQLAVQRRFHAHES
jgi:hypothetical protein